MTICCTCCFEIGSHMFQLCLAELPAARSPTSLICWLKPVKGAASLLSWACLLEHEM